MASRARLDVDGLRVQLREFDERLNRGVAQVVDYQATQTESFMRANAPWTDRTSNARNGLQAIPTRAGSTHRIILTHSVPYGIWLEVRWSGKYGIIPESFRRGGRELMAKLNKLLQKI